MSRRSNAAVAALVEDLEHADDPVVVGERHRDQRPRHVAGLLGGRPAEPRVGRDVGEGDAAGRSRTRSRRRPGRRRWPARRRPGPARRPRPRTRAGPSPGRGARSRRPRRRTARPSPRRSSAGRRVRAAGLSRRRGLDPEGDRPDAPRARAGRSRRPDAPVVRSAGSPPAVPVTARSCAPVARRSTTTSWSRSRRTRPWSARSASSRFTDWREPPIIPASSDWVYGHGIRIAPSARSGAARLGEPDDPRREAAGQVEEVEVLDVAGQAPDLRRERGEERPAEPRVACR